MEKEKQPTYTQAINRLETLVARMEQADIDIDELQQMLKESKTLITFCKKKLYKADADVKKLLQDFEQAD